MKSAEPPPVFRPLSARMAALALLFLVLPLAALAAYGIAIKTPVSGLPFVIIITENNIRPLAALVFGFIVFDFIIFYLLFRRMSRRLTALSQKIKMMRDGIYEPDVPAETSDEIGLLAGSVNELSRTLRENVRRRVFKLNTSAQQPLCTGTERVNTCAIYIEIENWEQKSSLVSGKRLIALLAKFYALAANCIHKTEGVIDSYLDAQMYAVWGGQEAFRHPERAIYQCIRCALLVRHAVYRYNKYQRNKALRIKTNMGIHYGPVTAGLVKVGDMPELKITGGNLDKARKTAAPANECDFDILISDAVYDAVSYYIITETVPTASGTARALVNIRNTQALKQTHPRTVDEVRTIMNWRFL